MAVPSPGQAASGTWTNLASGNWSVTNNWNGGIAADGSSNTADFSTLNLTGDTTIHLDSARTIGSLIFGDTDTNTAAGWILDNDGNTANSLTLAGGTPRITVNALGAGKTVTISTVLVGTNGLVKDGAGTLTLDGPQSFGTMLVSNGIVKVAAGGSLCGVSAVKVYAGAQLTVQASNNLSPYVQLSLFGTPYAKVNLNADATVLRLYMNGTCQTNGTWGATGSGAQYTNDNYFSGSGKLTVQEWGASYIQNFDDWPTKTTLGTYTNDGWIVINARIAGVGAFVPASQTNAVWLDDFMPTATTTYVQSPLLTNGIGTIYVATRTRASGTNIVAIKTSTDGITWNTNGVFTNNVAATWTTSSVTANTSQSMYVRIQKIGDDAMLNQFLGIDDIVVGGWPSWPLEVFSDYGSPVPGRGTNWVTMPTCRADWQVVEGTTQHICAGWVGTGSAPASGTGNSVSFIMGAASTLTWLWTTNYWLEVSAAPGRGTVTPGSGWYADGSNVVLTASNLAGYAFLGWHGDTNGCVINGAEITVPATQSRSVGADFTGGNIAVVPTRLMFFDAGFTDSVPQTLIVTNTGDAPMDYTIGSDKFWLSADVTTGSLAAGAGTTHVVRAAITTLVSNSYNGTLTLSSSTATNGPVTVPVTVLRPRQVVAWGDNTCGQTNVPAGLTNVVAVGAGCYHSLVVRSDGTVVAWGTNTYGQTNVPGWLTNAVAAAGGVNHSLALRSDGTVVAWGDNTYGQTNVPAGLTNAVAVAAGDNHCLALRSDGTVVAWGFNGSGQTIVPGGLINVVAVVGGGWHSLALRSNGTVVAWGLNNYGQTTVPGGLTNAVAVAAGGFHSLALRSTGAVVAWGNNSNGQTNVPAWLTNAVAVTAGCSNSVAIRADGTVVAWGANGYGQTNVPAWLTNVFAVAGGGYHSLGLVSIEPLVINSTFAAPAPGRGINWCIRNTMQTCTVTQMTEGGTTQYVCAGWVGTGSVPSSGTSNSVTFAITNASTLTWQWAATSYWLAVQANGGGTVNTGSSWYTIGSNVVLTATNLAGYSFVGWRGDTNDCVINGMEITVPVTGPRSLRADFTGGNMAVEPTSLAFSGQVYRDVAPQTLNVTNTGDGAMDYTIRSDIFWLCADVTNGSLAAGEGTTHVVRVGAKMFIPTVQTGNLTFISSTATNSPITIPVTLNIGSVFLPSKVVAWGTNDYGQTNVPAWLTNAVAVAGGSSHSLALRSDGSVVAWGLNNYGQTNVPPWLTNAVAVSGGFYHSLALRSDGRVAAWGDNTYGQTNVPIWLTNAVAVAAGAAHCLALRSDGRVAAWGWNNSGQTNVPVWLTNVVIVAAGFYHSLALRSDGTVVAWGSNGNGQTNVPAWLTNAVAVAGAEGGYFSLALRSNGAVVAWGQNGNGQTNVPVWLTNAVAVVGGGYHSLALRSDGTVVSWGQNTYGQTNVPAGLTNVVAVAGGCYHSLALAPSAPLTLSSTYGSPSPARGTNWLIRNALQTCTVDVQVAFGTTQYVCTGWSGSGSAPGSGTSNTVSFVITNDSAITWLWGWTNYWLEVTARDCGSVTPGSGWYGTGSNVVLTASNWPGHAFLEWAGDTNGCAINGAQITVPMTGSRQIQAQFTAGCIGVDPGSLLFSGQVYSAIAPQMLTITNSGNGPMDYVIGSDRFWLSADVATGSLAVGAGTTHVVRVATLGLETRIYNGNLIVSSSFASNSPVSVPVTLTIGSVLLPSLVVAWGNNASGQTNVPAELTNAVAVSGGTGHSLALKADGRVVAWGQNGNGQTNVPAWLTNAVSMSAGGYHSLALRSNGTVVAWGQNTYGQTNVPAGLTNAVAVAGGYYYSLALRSDGRVAAWGDNTYGQTNVPAGLTNAVAVVGAGMHCLALRSDRTVVAWGRSNEGQTNVPAGLTNVVAVAGGWTYSLALRSDGSVAAWGDNTYGQTDVPVWLTNAVAIASGVDGNQCLALRSDGMVVAWGQNTYNQTNVPAWLTNVVRVAGGGSHSLALAAPAESLVVFSSMGSPTPGCGTNWFIRNAPWTCTVSPHVQGATQYVCIGWTGSGSVPDSGTSNTLTFVLTNSSTLTWLWAATNYWIEVQTKGGGVVTPGSGWYANGSNVVLMASNNTGCAFLGWRGDTNGCDINDAMITIPVAGPRSITADFSAGNISVAPTNLTFSGEAYTEIAPQPIALTNTGAGLLNYAIQSDVFWLSADKPNGSLAPGMSTSVTVQVATRGLAPRSYGGRLIISDPFATNSPQVVTVNLNVTSLKPPSFMVAWGRNDDGQTNVPVWLTNAVAVDAGTTHSLAQRSDGTVVAWGQNTYGQTNVPVWLTNAVAVAGGGSHSLALRSDRTVVAWGRNNNGQTNVPVWLTNAVAVAGGYYHSLVLRDDGTVVAWGYNTDSQTNVPPWLTNAVAVAGGFTHSLALRADGTIVAWGHNTAGETNVPPWLTNAVAVSGGNCHSLALRSDGTVVAWGGNTSGETNVPAGLTNVVAVASGCFAHHSLALRSDGTVVAWGDNYFGQTTVPSWLTNAVAVAAGGYHSLALVSPKESLIVVSEFGSPSPGRGTNRFVRNTVQVCTVSSQMISIGATQYVSAGWVGSGSVPDSGTSNTVSFVLTNSSTLTWLWTTNYWLGIGAGANGAVNWSSNWYGLGTNLSLQAFPSNYYHFDNWTGTLSVTDNPYGLLVTRPEDITAMFGENLATNTSTPEWWLAGYGWTNDFEAAATNDPDSDGVPAWKEYIAGTDPTNKASVFQIVTNTTDNTGTNVVLTWPSASNRLYDILRSGNLATQAFGVVASNIAATPPVNVHTGAMGAAESEYYRVKVRKP